MRIKRTILLAVAVVLALAASKLDAEIVCYACNTATGQCVRVPCIYGGGPIG